jgi:hypothetical protein
MLLLTFGHLNKIRQASKVKDVSCIFVFEKEASHTRHYSVHLLFLMTKPITSIYLKHSRLLAQTFETLVTCHINNIIKIRIMTPSLLSDIRIFIPVHS